MRLHGASDWTSLSRLKSPTPGFRFGHSLYGNADFETVHFAFQFIELPRG